MSDILITIAIALLLLGLWMMYHPAALIAAALIIYLISVRIERDKKIGGS